MVQGLGGAEARPGTCAAIGQGGETRKDRLPEVSRERAQRGS